MRCTDALGCVCALGEFFLRAYMYICVHVYLPKFPYAEIMNCSIRNIEKILILWQSLRIRDLNNISKRKES